MLSAWLRASGHASFYQSRVSSLNSLSGKWMAKCYESSLGQVSRAWSPVRLLWVLALDLRAGWGFLCWKNQRLQGDKRRPQCYLRSQDLERTLIRSELETNQIPLFHWASVSTKSAICQQWADRQSEQEIALCWRVSGNHLGYMDPSGNTGGRREGSEERPGFLAGSSTRKPPWRVKWLPHQRKMRTDYGYIT